MFKTCSRCVQGGQEKTLVFNAFGLVQDVRGRPCGCSRELRNDESLEGCVQGAYPPKGELVPLFKGIEATEGEGGI